MQNWHDNVLWLIAEIDRCIRAHEGETLTLAYLARLLDYSQSQVSQLREHRLLGFYVKAGSHSRSGFRNGQRASAAACPRSRAADGVRERAERPPAAVWIPHPVVCSILCTIVYVSGSISGLLFDFEKNS